MQHEQHDYDQIKQAYLDDGWKKEQEDEHGVLFSKDLRRDATVDARTTERDAVLAT